mgnify:CR=1 FL=1
MRSGNFHSTLELSKINLHQSQIATMEIYGSIIVRLSKVLSMNLQKIIWKMKINFNFKEIELIQVLSMKFLTKKTKKNKINLSIFQS